LPEKVLRSSSPRFIRRSWTEAAAMELRSMLLSISSKSWTEEAEKVLPFIFERTRHMSRSLGSATRLSRNSKLSPSG
jgi:hypothetical protein